MTPYPKNKPWRSEKYKAWIRKQPCLASGTGQVIAHHHQEPGNHGTSTKPSDYWCVPLSVGFHLELHLTGKNTFYKKYDIDIHRELFKLLSEYIKGDNQ